jgi:hypothetical protein
VKVVEWTEKSAVRFLGTALAMGLNPALRVVNYWKSGMYGSTFIKEHMSRDEYVLMKRSLSFDVDVLCEHLNKVFKMYWNPHEDVAIDESLVGTKTRYKMELFLKTNLLFSLVLGALIQL